MAHIVGVELGIPLYKGRGNEQSKEKFIGQDKKTLSCYFQNFDKAVSRLVCTFSVSHFGVPLIPCFILNKSGSILLKVAELNTAESFS